MADRGKPKKQKFDAQDRYQTIAEIENRCGVKLRPIGRRPKYLIDANSNRYWVLGGYDYWHGVPSAMMDAEVRKADKAALYIAVRKTVRIVIYSGSVEPLVASRDRLSRNIAGDYHFTLDERGGHLHVKEIPGVRLALFAVRDYSIDQKVKDKDSFIQNAKIKTLYSRLSNVEKSAFLSNLQDM